MVLLMLVAVVGAIAVTWVLNRTFLEDYYLYSKMDMLDDVFQTVGTVVSEAEAEARTAALEEQESEKEEKEESDGFLIDEFGVEKGTEEDWMVLRLSEQQKLELDVQAIRNDVSILIAQNSRSVYFTSTSSGPETMFYMLDRILPRLYPGHKAEFNFYEKIKTVDDTYDLYKSYEKENFLESKNGSVNAGGGSLCDCRNMGT